MEQMTLSRYYDELPRPTPPKTEFVKRVAERCGVDTQTVRYWLRGDRLPGRESHLDILSEMTGIPKDQLFANPNNE